MKTKELKKIVEDNGYSFEKRLNYIFIRRCDELVMQLTGENIIKLTRGYELYSKQIKTVMKALIEYSETPIEEREEEKKYEITFEEQILAKKDSSEFYFMWNFAHTVYQTIFTQSEIDNFPPEIKGAIECGFLKKVKVEE